MRQLVLGRTGLRVSELCFGTMQAYYNLAARELERELVPMLEDQRVGLPVWSPLAGGFLSGKVAKDATSWTGSMP